MTLLRLALAALVLLLAPCAAACSPPVERALVTPPPESLDPRALPAIDGLVAQALRAGTIPGAQLEVLVNGKTAIRKAYGDRTFEPHPVPNGMHTLYELASLTKPLATASAIMLLVQRGVLRLDDPVARFIPEFAQNGKGEVTIEQMLLHTSGMPPSFERADYDADRATILAHAYASALEFAPGTAFAYSNLAYIVLAEVVARVAHEPFETFCARELFAPLGMRDSFFDVTLDTAHAALVAPQVEAQTEPKLRAAFGTVPGVNGHAGMLSTADDVARFAASLLAALGDPERQTGPLAPATVRATIDPHYAGAGEVRGLGWDLDSAFSRNRGDLLGRGGFGHTGSSGTSLWIDPARRLAIVFLSNAHYPHDLGSTVPLEAKITNVIAASLRNVDADAVIEQESAFDAAVARSALAFPTGTSAAPAPQATATQMRN